MVHLPRGAVLRTRHDLSETLARFRFELEDGVPEFRPGQFITLGLHCPPDNALIWRPYSVASPPSDRSGIELLVRHSMEPAPGRFTSVLWEMPLGAHALHRGIKGAFTMEDSRPDGAPETRSLLCLAGGTGLAPFMSYALEMHARRTPREIVIVHGASHVDELAWRDVLERMQEETRSTSTGAFRLRYIPTISRPGAVRNAGWAGETGRVEALLSPAANGRSRIEELLGRPLQREAFFVHACGFDATVAAVLAALEPRGFASTRKRHLDGSYDIKYESYG